MLNIELINDDCLSAMGNIPDKSIDMIFTDLPYGTTKDEKDKPIDLDALWEQYNRIVKDNGVIALWAQSPFDKILACSNLPMYRYEWIVEKGAGTGFLNAKKMPLKCHENVLIFYKKLPIYNPQMTHGHERKVSTVAHKRNCKKTVDYGSHGLTGYDSTDRYPRDVLKFSWDKQKSSLHPQQKPVAACEYFIKTYTNKRDIVLDSTMGSGTTGVAAITLNRSFIGIEKDSERYAVAKGRITPLVLNLSEKTGFPFTTNERNLI